MIRTRHDHQELRVARRPIQHSIIRWKKQLQFSVTGNFSPWWCKTGFLCSKTMAPTCCRHSNTADTATLQNSSVTHTQTAHS